jgi:hypothetical protein
VAKQVVTPGNIERFVDQMFDQVFSESERAELLVWIHRWEAENPDVDSAHRVTGWIDVAYSFQARTDLVTDSPERKTSLDSSGWTLVHVFA